MKKALIILCFIPMIATGQINRELDSLHDILDTSSIDTTKILLLTELSWVSRITQPDSSISYAQNALRIIEAQKGTVVNEREPMLSWFQKATSQLYYILGELNWRISDYDMALDHLFNALKLRTQYRQAHPGDRAVAGTIGSTLNIIGIIYRYQGENQKAIKYYKQALALMEEIDNKTGVAIQLCNIGIAHNQEEEYDKALEYYFRALAIDEELDDQAGIAADLGSIANTYYSMGDEDTNNLELQTEHYTKALEYYFRTLAVAESVNDKNRIAIQQGNLGSLLNSMKRYSESEHYLLEALSTSKELGSLYQIQAWAFELSEVASKRGDFEKALSYYKEYTEVNDSIFNQDKSRELGKLEAKHEFEVAEADRIRKEKEQIEREETAKSRRDNLQFSGILIFLVLAFTGVYFTGKISIPDRLAEGMIFFSFLLFFEFMLVLLDPIIEDYSGGAPAFKLMFNAVLAAGIFPLHAFFEGMIKRRLVK